MVTETEKFGVDTGKKRALGVDCLCRRKGAATEFVC